MNKNLLPRVSIEISASLEHELTGKKDAAYIKQQLKLRWMLKYALVSFKI